MASGDSGEKTEDPTEHRRQEARRKGNVARSIDLNAASLMMAAAVVIYLLGFGLFTSLGLMLKKQIAQISGEPLGNGDLVLLMQASTENAIPILLPVLMIMFFSAVAINLAQFGFLMTTESLQPKLSHINPIKGLQKIFSIRSVMKLLVSLSKLFIITVLSVWTMYSLVPQFAFLSGLKPSDISVAIHSSISTLAFQLAAALLILALLDFGFQKWKHTQDMMMSKQEIRDEMKNMDGDPHIRQRRREAHMKLTQARELNAVENADVVITNPTRISIAIKYDPEVMDAPIVVAKGKGEIARRIREIAAQNDVPLIERKPLARALYATVKVGQSIPADMYEVFVEIMAYVYQISGKKLPNT
jgi:flagellar biosynthesis protein FlhB